MSDLIVPVAIALAVVAANAAAWRLWASYIAESLRIARDQRDHWIGQHGEQERRAGHLAAENARLAAENDQLRRAEVAHLPAKQTGDQT